MNEQYLILYKKLRPADDAYLIAEGRVLMFVTEADKYILEGKNLIIGGSELVLAQQDNISITRMETALANKGTTIKKIPVTTFFQGLDNPAFALNIAVVEAKMVVLTNEILKKNLQIDEHIAKEREICVQYYKIIQALENEYNKRRIPWLKECIDKFKPSIIYKKGESYAKSMESLKLETPKELASNMIEFSPGSIICQEGTKADCMFILESGQLEVYIQNTKVAKIHDKGTVIGEIAMLLSMPRTATIKAVNSVVLTRISKDDLRHSMSSALIQHILISLVRKHHANVHYIDEINERKALAYAEKTTHDHDNIKRIDTQRYYNELLHLRDTIEKLVKAKQMDFLNYIIEI